MRMLEEKGLWKGGDLKRTAPFSFTAAIVSGSAAMLFKTSKAAQPATAGGRHHCPALLTALLKHERFRF
jgi:hypothetical protein